MIINYGYGLVGYVLTMISLIHAMIRFIVSTIIVLFGKREFHHLNFSRLSKFHKILDKKKNWQNSNGKLDKSIEVIEFDADTTFLRMKF
jgi:hypothetical protein